MSNDFADIIRTLVRENNSHEREKSRSDMFNKSRVIPADAIYNNKTFNGKDINRFVKELKRLSSSCKESILSDLKKAFIQDRSNMIAFLKIEGGLHALVGYLTSANPRVQLLAAECCCNLSLGDAKTCHQLAKSAAPYLILILQGMNYNVMNYSLMTLGNLCATSKKAVKIIKTQGALKAFEHTVTFPETRESTAFALVMYSNASFPQDSDLFINITYAVLPFMESSLNIQWLLYHLSTAEVTNCILVEQHIGQRIITQLNSFGKVEGTNVQSATCLVRAMASLCSEPSGTVAKVVFDHWVEVMELAKHLLASGYGHLRAEVAWLFGNLVNHTLPTVQELVLSKRDDFEWLGNSCCL